jgi:hypothetical protein
LDIIIIDLLQLIIKIRDINQQILEVRLLGDLLEILKERQKLKLELEHI